MQPAERSKSTHELATLGEATVPVLRAHFWGEALLAKCGLTPFSAIGEQTHRIEGRISDEADFIGGVIVPWGARSADSPIKFGLAPVTVFLETRFCY